MKLKLTEKDKARFWAKVRKTRGCWHWTAYKLKGGYGQFQLGTHGRPVSGRAHRLVYELVNGPTKLHVLHTCDNPSCVNPKHLFAGTQADNMRDMAAKGRQSSPLTEDEVKMVLELSATMSHRALGRKFKVCKTTISNILSGKNWSSLTGIKPV